MSALRENPLYSFAENAEAAIAACSAHNLKIVLLTPSQIPVLV